MNRFFKRAMLPAVALFTISAGASRAPLQAQTVNSEFLTNYAQVERKFSQLAEAIPFEKFSWRPMAGVRSVCEVFMHVAVDNYLLGKPFGAVAPKEMEGPTAEQCLSDKAKVVAAMKASFDAIKAGVGAMTAADAMQPYTLFGATQSKRAWLLATAEHAGEHLGQQIAYARMNGIVPPWSK
ncbi:MAG: DinB family protein [Gemmatimonadetes bacterium]|nr:DinB family protein [Gemmatimonadota bacterium]